MNVVLDLKGLKVGATVSNDFVFVQEYSERSYDEGRKSYIAGTLVQKGMQFAFKIWDAGLVKIFRENEITGNIIAVAGSVKEYKGVLELTIQSVNFSPACTDKSLFIKSVDVSNTFSTFADFVNTNLSPKGVEVMMKVFAEPELLDRFKVEYAGSKLHDAQIGGLMSHEYKMLRIAQTLIENDARIVDNAKLKDLIYLGVIFHDIGKVFEMNNGVYTKNSYVTHIVFGIELISKYKEVIVEAYDEDFYYQLLAIIQGHHGEFGDRPRTVPALIVHLIDMLDCRMTSALDKYEAGNVTKNDTGVASMYDNGVYYTYPTENIMGEF